MCASPILETPRLRLRPFDITDVDALAPLNADPVVARFLGSGQTLDRDATWRQIATFLGHGVLRGYSMLAIDDRATGALLGRSGPWFPEGWPMLEVGWVINPARQGQGLATEAGRASLDWSFAHLDVDEICSLVAPENVASARVAEKLGAQIEDRVMVMGHAADLWVHRRPNGIPTPAASPPPQPAPETYAIETERLHLRPFRETDLDDLARLYADSDVMRYIGDGKTLDRAQTWRQMALYLGHLQIRGYSTLAIEDRETGRLLGECGAWFPAGWPMLEVGWLVNPSRQGRGIATEAGRAALASCFERGADAVCSVIHPQNAASARVATKLGGRIERRIEMFGRPQDLWVYRAPPTG